MINKFTYINELICRYPNLKICLPDILSGYKVLENCYNSNRKLLIAGNGGSAADALHIVGELMKGFILHRSLNSDICNKLNEYSNNAEYLKKNLQMALPAIALVNEISLTTAYGNDMSSELIFAQQIVGYGNTGDVFLGISTSGNSQNIIYAAQVAKSLGLKVIGLTGETGGKLNNVVDVCIRVPEKITYKVQELHLPIYHSLCLELEKYFFKETN